MDLRRFYDSNQLDDQSLVGSRRVEVDDLIANR